MIKDRRVLAFSIIGAIIFCLFYLWSIGNIHLNEFNSGVGFTFLPNWKEVVFKAYAPFLWEPIGIIAISKSISIFFSPVNLAIALLLSVLVFVNLIVVSYSYIVGRVCDIKPSGYSILGFVPALLAGFSGGISTFYIYSGVTNEYLTLLIIHTQPLFIPASIILLIFGFWWSSHFITNKKMDICEAHYSLKRKK